MGPDSVKRVNRRDFYKKVSIRSKPVDCCDITLFHKNMAKSLIYKSFGLIHPTEMVSIISFIAEQEI